MKKLKAILSTSESAICISLNEKDVCIDMEAIFELTNSQNADIDPLSHLYVDNDENKVIVESLGVPTDIEFEVEISPSKKGSQDFFPPFRRRKNL